MLVVIVNLGNRTYPGVLLGRDAADTARSEVPVQNPADKRRDQIGAGIRTGNSLRETEEQGEITVYAFFFEFRCGLNTFPGRRDLDQYPAFVAAPGFVKSNQAPRPRDGCFAIEGQPCIDFSRDTPGNRLLDFEADTDREIVAGGSGAGCRITFLILRPFPGLFQQGLISRQVGGFQ